MASESQQSGSSAAWESTQRTYEGFPLYLRRPTGLDFDALCAKFPVRMTITHKLSFRRFDGAPEPKYNRGLEDFDVSVTRYFLDSGDGRIVLVETFGGERNYYFYVSDTVNVDEVVKDLRGKFPGFKLEGESRTDAAWNFIRRYTADYFTEA